MLDTLRAVLILAAFIALGLQAFSLHEPLPSLAWAACTSTHRESDSQGQVIGCTWEDRTFFQNLAELCWPNS